MHKSIWLFNIFSLYIIYSLQYSVIHQVIFNGFWLSLFALIDWIIYETYSVRYRYICLMLQTAERDH